MINNFALACAIDRSPAYFTYSGETMLIIQSAQDAKSGTSSFAYIEPFMGALTSHEAIHVAIKKIEGDETSESLDDIEVIVEHNGRKFQVTLNNMLFARDESGLVLPAGFSCSALKNATLTEADAANALRQMLEIGVRQGVQGSFSKDAVMATLFPESMRKTLNTLQQLGFASDGLVLRPYS